MCLRKYRFYVIDKEFTEYLYEAVVLEGWSFTYACSNIRGGVDYVKTQFEHHPFIKEIHGLYLEKVKFKNKKYRFNMSLMG